MSFLEIASKLAEEGFYVFPLKPNSKLPAIDDFPNRATRDQEAIKKFWLDPVMGTEQPYNVGISTSKFNGNQALVVVDVDDKGKKRGSDELLKLELSGHGFVETAYQSTPSGGQHLIYRAPEPVKQGESVLAKGLDIRSKGGYIVASGSVIDGKKYSWGKIKEVAQCPDWIIKECGRPVEKEKIEVDAAKVSKRNAAKRAVHYLEKEAPIAIEGDGGDHTTFKVSAHLKDLGVEPEAAVELLLDHWNDRCEPPWKPDELEDKVRNAYKYGLKSFASSAPEADFSKIEDSDCSGSYLAQMNKEFALIFDGGQHSILHETIDERGRPARKFYKEITFRRKFSPKTVQQDRGPAKSFADVWLDWDGRREYAGLCFKPEQKARNGYYNLWRGFVCEPRAYGDATKKAQLGFDLFIEHAKQNVCEGDEELFKWLMGYYAHLVQKPYQRPLTTLVFKGAKGVGKNALVDRIGNLLGQGHYLVAHDSRYLTSNFNGHLDSCLCLVLDEAFWSGDKSSEGKLKGITTAPEIMIERKGKEPYTVDNLVRLVVIGNEDWLVPASHDERRYAVFAVGEGRKQDGAYFKKMRELVDDAGGNQVLLHYLKNFDLSTVDVNTPPKTKALQDQKIGSLSSIEQFWMECLMEGKILGLEFCEEWEPRLEKEKFRRAFTAYCRQRNIKSWVPDQMWIGRHLAKMTPSTDFTQKKKVDNGYRKAYTFQSLEACREDFDKYIGGEIEWD